LTEALAEGLEYVDVGLMMFLMVNGHDLPADVRLENMAHAGEVGENMSL